jgi:RNA polymerase sigma-70 factor (ECF subfamily)
MISNDLHARPPSETQRGNVEETTDEALMLAVSRGDLDAFNELILLYQELAWRTAYRFLGDAMEAEDIAQDTFLKILEAAPRYRPTSTFRTYFYNVLIHLCIDRIRKKKPFRVDEIPDMADPSQGPERSLIDKEQRNQVRKALAQLSDRQRAALVLRHFEGLSYNEIALVLRATPKAVERLLARAMASLQALLH